MNSSDYLLNELERRRKKKEESASEARTTLLLLFLLPFMIYGCMWARWHYTLLEKWMFE